MSTSYDSIDAIETPRVALLPPQLQEHLKIIPSPDGTAFIKPISADSVLYSCMDEEPYDGGADHVISRYEIHVYNAIICFYVDFSISNKCSVLSVENPVLRRSISRALLDWRHIWEWAASSPPGAVLGESCTNSACPLAAYLSAQTGGQYWSVGPAIKNLSTGQRLEKPAWVQALIERTDETTYGAQGPITREAFLAALEQVRHLAPEFDNPPGAKSNA